MITSFPLDQDVLFLSLPRTTSDLLSKSLCCSFTWPIVAVMSPWLCTSLEHTVVFWQVPLLLPLTGCFVNPLESHKIPLSSHFSTNCYCPGEKLLLSPGFHSITLHPSDSPLWITAEPDCHLCSEVIQWVTHAEYSQWGVESTCSSCFCLSSSDLFPKARRGRGPAWKPCHRSKSNQAVISPVTQRP